MSKLARVAVTRILETDLYFLVADDCDAEDAASIVQKKIEADSFEFFGYDWDNVWGDQAESYAEFVDAAPHDPEWDFTQPGQKPEPPTMGEPEERHWSTAHGKRWVTDGYTLVAEGEERHKSVIWGDWRDDVADDGLSKLLGMDGPHEDVALVGTTTETGTRMAPIGLLYQRGDGVVVCINAEYVPAHETLTAKQGPSVLSMVRLYRDGEMVRGVMPISGEFAKPEAP